MNDEPKDVIVLGAIKHGFKKFEKIQKITQIEPNELNGILEQLENRGFIKVEKKKGWLGEKVEIKTTEKGSKEVDQRVHELQAKWTCFHLIAVLISPCLLFCKLMTFDSILLVIHELFDQLL